MAPRSAVTRAAITAVLAGLDRADLAGQRWFGAKGRTITSVGLEDAFELDDAGPHVLAIAVLRFDDRTTRRYSFALTGRPLRVATPGDGTWRALAVAMAEGRTVAALPPDDDPAAAPTAALVCRPGRAMTAGIGTMTERDLGADQSNASVVLGETVLLKAFRQLQAGLDPELELVAFLAEEVDFPAVPPLAGFAEVVSAGQGTTTVAVAQAFVADGADLYESLAEALVAWMLAPGAVSLEFATEVPADLGTLVAGLHLALMSRPDIPDLAPRDATRQEVRAWSTSARANLDAALEDTAGEEGRVLRSLAPAIVAELTVLDAIATVPRVMRAHGDLHLGQILIAPDGYRVIDFGGDPLASIAERRAHRSALRDLASMLRSLDHVGRSAGRRAQARNGGPLSRSGLDLDGWLIRSRERFLDGYRKGLCQAGERADIDLALLRAFEIDKELTEFTYAAAYLPSWSWAPTEGMAGLIACAPTGLDRVRR